MMAVSSVHEEVHEWAGEERQPEQQPEHVSPVFGEQERAGDDQESYQDQAGLGFG
ncbi:hypothetical protein CDS [Bradyrhizobium sp.]|jgi:hypothetical protein|nr:hypothetical protein CDS [Bradyrhizobium sp.]